MILNRFVSLLSDTDTEQEKTLLTELLEYIDSKYFSPQQYENFNFGSDGLVSVKSIVIGFCVGMILAAALSLYNKRVLGNFVRSLISMDCGSPASARTIGELGYLKNSAVRSSLRRGFTLRKFVRCVEEDEYDAELKKKEQEYYESLGVCFEGKDPEEIEQQINQLPKSVARFKRVRFAMDLNMAHFYIPEKDFYTAEVKFEKKGTNPLTFVFTIVAAIAIMVAIVLILPWALQLIDNMLTSIKAEF